MNTVLIPLTQGKVAVIDATDVPLINQYRWWAVRSSKTYYAATKVHRPDGTRRVVFMHRILLSDPSAPRIDHINRDGLDNRRQNLRLATWSQNKANSDLYANNRSGFKGVVWKRTHRQWEAYISFEKRRYFLGLYRTPEAAAHAYDAKARELHGEFARCNFPAP